MKMKSTCFVSVLLLVSSALFAQRKEYFAFQEKVFDFGTVREAGGPVTHTFAFENTGDRPIKILDVRPSCGCTTPDWTKEIINQGAKGFITAKFDPKSRPGFFSKTLTITSDYTSEPIVLTIKGTVSLTGDHTAYRESKGNWRLLASSFNMGKVLLKDEYTWKEFEVVNTGESSITVQDDVKTPAYVRVQISPSVLKPGEKGTIRIGYHGKMKNAYGFQSDNVEFITDDEAMPRKSFSVYATLEDYFPEQSKEALDKAPHLVLSETLLDMGRFSSSNSLEKSITLSNTGKKELSLRAIQPNCQCLTVTPEDNTIEPGKSITLRVKFDPAQQRKGTLQKFITFYTNDPVNPVQRLSIAAYVEN